MIRDPELRLDELAQMQDEVAMLLGFGGPAAEAAKSVGMKFTPDGKLETKVVKAKESKVEVSDVAASSTESEEEMGEVPEDELTDHSTELAA